MSKASNGPTSQSRTNRTGSGGARTTPDSTRLIVGIGDLHGHYLALERLHNSLQSAYHIFQPHEPDGLRPEVTLVFTGDYIDRGGIQDTHDPYPIATLRPGQSLRD